MHTSHKKQTIEGENKTYYSLMVSESKRDCILPFILFLSLTLYRTFSLSQMSRDQVYLGYAMARPDDKPRAISSSLEYCRGAEEEDKVNFRSSESRTLSLLNCYVECRRKSSSIKRLCLYEPLRLYHSP